MTSTENHRRKVVVDGSNIATEGRSIPSLAQLEQAIAAFFEEYPGFELGDLIVVVDATFGHRIEASERSRYEDAVAHGEMVTPPAGAIGRGDAFILRIAEKAGALVLSNDSFQEFHVERPWLFEAGRLIGGKPIPGVGWIFTPRSPVRGPVSRATVSKAKRQSATDLGDGAAPAKAPARTRKKTALAGGAPPVATKASAPKKTAVKKAAAKKTPSTTKAKATREASPAEASSEPPKKRARTKKAMAAADLAVPAPRLTPPEKSPPALNEPMTFLRFVADHPVGSSLTGTVAAFTSHGAHIDVDGMRCHVPLGGIRTPAPQKARDVLTRGETYQFTLVSLDAPRRRAELKLDGPDAIS